MELAIQALEQQLRINEVQQGQLFDELHITAQHIETNIRENQKIKAELNKLKSNGTFLHLAEVLERVANIKEGYILPAPPTIMDTTTSDAGPIKLYDEDDNDFDEEASPYFRSPKPSIPAMKKKGRD